LLSEVFGLKINNDIVSDSEDYQIVSAGSRYVISAETLGNGPFADGMTNPISNIYKSFESRSITIEETVGYFNAEPMIQTSSTGVSLEYTTDGNELTVSVSYKIADYVQSLPRFGFEFGVDKEYSRFSYVGFGPYESYIDRHASCDYDYFVSSAGENYDMKYIRPQESGSHFACKYLAITNLFEMTAEKPFSCSVNPYTTEQIRETLHSFELTENDFVNVCVDVAMRGVGSHSCGPELPSEFEIPREGSNTFKLIF
jgi:hypothetical protein